MIGVRWSDAEEGSIRLFTGEELGSSETFEADGVARLLAAEVLEALVRFGLGGTCSGAGLFFAICAISVKKQKVRTRKDWNICDLIKDE